MIIIMDISRNFKLSEFEYSDTAIKYGIENKPNQEELLNVTALVAAILQPLRDSKGRIRITSGGRSNELNKLIAGSSSTSDHCKWKAADIQGLDCSNSELFEWIKKNCNFDQLIWEYGDSKNPDWVHVSFRRMSKNRRQVMRCSRVNGKPRYEYI